MTDLYLPDLPPENWPGLPEPDFFERDPAALEARMIARYEALTGKQLYPGQPERLMINLMAYQLSLHRVRSEIAARQNLLRYATGVVLDLKGEGLDTARLQEASARATVRFEIAEELAFPVAIPAATRIATADHSFVFATEIEITIPAGETMAETVSICQTPGTAANGLVSGQISTLVDPVPYITAAVNVSISNGGADTEADIRYRDRIRTAPRRFSTAGPGAAYKWHVLAASQVIIDAIILGPEDGLEPGQVEIYPLTADGLPSDEILALVDTWVAKDRQLRPDTDQVTVRTPVEISFDVTASIRVYRDADVNTVLKAVQANLAAITAEWRQRLGADIVRSQLIAAAHTDGVYDIELTAPAADRVLASNEWANGGAITVTLDSQVDG